MKYVYLLPITLVSLCLAGCATSYKAGGGGSGYSDTQYAPGQFGVHFNGNANTSVVQSRDFALLHAAELTLTHGYRYFVVFDRTPRPVAQAPSMVFAPNVEVNNYSYGNTYNYGTGMQWHDSNGAASANASAGLSRLALFLDAQKEQRRLAQSELLVRCFEVKPPGIDLLDANLVAGSLRDKYGIKANAPTIAQDSRSQQKPMSGSYLGSGTSVAGGVEQPYQIALEVFDSGKVSFACSAFVNNQPVVVTGKGAVDSDGNVTVQNEFGDIGHGTISGRILKAGGESQSGSIKSFFTALKQENVTPPARRDSGELSLDELLSKCEEARKDSHLHQFEQRTYYPTQGKLDALVKRLRDSKPILERHGLHIMCRSGKIV